MKKKWKYLIFTMKWEYRNSVIIAEYKNHFLHTLTALTDWISTVLLFIVGAISLALELFKLVILPILIIGVPFWYAFFAGNKVEKLMRMKNKNVESESE